MLWTYLSVMPTKYKISHPKAQFTNLLTCDLSPIFQGQKGQIDQKMPIIVVIRGWDPGFSSHRRSGTSLKTRVPEVGTLWFEFVKETQQNIYCVILFN